MGTAPQPRFVFLALMTVALCTAAAWARNCPTGVNQTVIVAHATPTAFALNVSNVEQAEISILQYPPGGRLVRNGGSQASYVFVPDAGFTGLSQAQFLLQSAADCPVSTQILVVTLAVAGPGQSNVNISGGLGVRPVVCGLDFLPITIPPLMALAVGVRRRRRAVR